jgi:hypothetical protein
MTVTEGTSEDNPDNMVLGAAYNVFDGEELLEASIRSIRSNVDYIVVVYQTISNFGQPCSPNLIPILENLRKNKLVEDLVRYDVRSFNKEERRNLLSPYADSSGLFQGGVETIAEQVRSFRTNILNGSTVS